MKQRILALTLAAAAAFTLAACDNQAQGGAAQAPAAASAPALNAAQAYAAIQKDGTGLTVGAGLTSSAADAKQTVYVFFDPQCPHCAHLWEASKPLLTNVRFVWMPVGLLSRASRAQGATILGASNPMKAMTENEQSIADHGNGITADSDAIARFGARVDTNTALFMKARSQDDGVPFIVAKVGNEVRMQSGALPTAQLKTFLGIGS